jgi:hypothetical protein
MTRSAPSWFLISPIKIPTQDQSQGVEEIIFLKLWSCDSVKARRAAYAYGSLRARENEFS